MARTRARARPASSAQPAGLAAALTAARPELRAEPRAEVRSEPRPEPRASDSRERAAQRAAQIRAQEAEAGDSDAVSEFDIPRGMQPDGWTYEWKMASVLNAEDPSYQVHLAVHGWEPVPASRHPAFMPRGYQGETITRKGMVLMEKPTEIVAESRARQLRAAKAQVREKEIQIGNAPQGQFDRANKDQSMVKIERSYSPVEIPD